MPHLARSIYITHNKTWNSWVLWTYKLNVFQSGKRDKNNYTQQTIKTMWNWQYSQKRDTRHVLMVCYLTSVSTAKITLPVLLKNLSSVQGLSSLKYVYNKTGLLSTTQTIKLKKNTQNQSQPQLIQPTFTLHGHLIQQIYYYYYYCCCLVCSSFAFSYVSCLMSFVICQYVVLVLLLVTWLWT